MPDLFNYSPNKAEPRYPNAPGHSNETTSKAAAEAIKPDLGRLQQRILDHIAAAPRTARECENDLGMRSQTVTARIRELVLAGRLEDSGEKRLTDSGRKAIVWRTKA